MLPAAEFWNPLFYPLKAELHKPVGKIGTGGKGFGPILRQCIQVRQASRKILPIDPG
jgi:hypothetical protein